MYELIETMFAGLIVGFIMATPPGIINITILNLISKQQFIDAFFLGAGSATLDIFYSLISIYSTSLIYQYIQNFISSNPKTVLFLEMIIIATLLILGISKITRNDQNKDKAKNSFFISKNLHPYFIGLLIATTHILIPSFLPSYAYLSAVLLDMELIQFSNVHFFAYAICFGIGTQIFYAVNIWLSMKKVFIYKDSNVKLLPILTGILFILVSLILSFKLLFDTNWSGIL